MRSCAPGAQRARVDDDACITTKIHIEEITPRYTTRYDPIEVYSYADDETAADAPTMRRAARTISTRQS